MSVWKQKASAGGGDFTPCPAGMWPAVLVGLFDVGTHTENGYMGAPAKDVRKVVLVWEVHTDEADAPFYVLRDYTLSFAEKASLRVLIQSWRGKEFGEDEEFDLSKLAGQTCYVNVVHKESQKGRTYARIENVTKLPKQIPAPKPAAAVLVWSVEDGDDFPAPSYEAFLRGTPLDKYVAEAHEVKRGKVTSGAHVNDTAAQAEEAF